MTLNIEFQEEYKRLDNLCKDCLKSREGVSEYIRQMASTPWSERRYANTWEIEYEQLKHIRWIRNQFAHEVGTLDYDICTEDDLEWVQSFYDRIINGSDPFAEIQKARMAEVALRADQQNQPKIEETLRVNRQEHSPKVIVAGRSGQTKSGQSFFGRLIAKIKKIFL